MSITQSKLKVLLNYDQETGIFTWNVSPNGQVKAGQVAGFLDVKGYLSIGVLGRVYKAHRLAWLYIHGHFPDDQIDHINGFKDDNRIANLRPANNQQNAINRGVRSDNKSGVKGVVWHKRDEKWSVNGKVNGKRIHLGYFDTLEAAAAARADFEIAHHGDFRRVI